MKKFAWFVGGVVVGAISTLLILPATDATTQDECILNNLGGAHSDIAVTVLTQVCIRMYGEE